MTAQSRFDAAIELLRRAGVPGAPGRLRDLFDYLAARGPEGEPATQDELAREVFGQQQTEGDDATVRVYVHRLRKKIEDFYARNTPAEGAARIDLPSGIYALRWAGEEVGVSEDRPAKSSKGRAALRYASVLAVLAMLAAFVAGMAFEEGRADASNAIWKPLLESDRPVLVVLGDYYIFGEIDPVRPELGRLIRDFRVNDPADLAALQDAEPERYGYAEDQGLNYLPFSAAYALEEVVPELASHGKQIEIIPASAFTADMLNNYDVVYLGLLSGMGLLEDVVFMTGGLRLGESYDEIVDTLTGNAYVSDEARSVASSAFYRDYAYVTRFVAPGDALVTVIAGQRDTGLRGIGPIVNQAQLPDRLQGVAESGAGFEIVIQITGQQGADLSERLIIARQRI